MNEILAWVLVSCLGMGLAARYGTLRGLLFVGSLVLVQQLAGCGGGGVEASGGAITALGQGGELLETTDHYCPPADVPFVGPLPVTCDRGGMGS
ncbi:MAG TPA: hypothetical protein PLF63_04025 [Rubrivivax sp.]|jgi:hypothetical protein|nr:hypothetical protein [Rubrivivax sp.]